MTATAARRLQDVLGLDDEELLKVLDVQPLELVSGEIEHRAEIGILLALLDDVRERVADGVLQRWLRTEGPSGRPLDMLLARDFGAFEGALATLAERGFVIRGGSSD